MGSGGQGLGSLCPGSRPGGKEWPCTRAATSFSAALWLGVLTGRAWEPREVPLPAAASGATRVPALGEEGARVGLCQAAAGVGLREEPSVARAGLGGSLL